MFVVSELRIEYGCMCAFPACMLQCVAVIVERRRDKNKWRVMSSAWVMNCVFARSMYV